MSGDVKQPPDVFLCGISELCSKQERSLHYGQKAKGSGVATALQEAGHQRLEDKESVSAGDKGNSFFNRLPDLSAYWLYVVAGLFLFVGFLSVGALGIWYIKQQVAVNIPPPTQATTNVRISVEPSSGGPGTPVRVTGQGWQAGDVVFVSLEAPFSTSNRDFAYAGAVVNDQGQFQVSFTFPQEERWANVGVAKVIAWGEQSGAKAVTIFQVAKEMPAPGTGPNLMFNEPTDLAQLTLSPSIQSGPAATPTVAAWPVLPAQNWYGEYFAGPNLSGSPVFMRDDREIQFDWGEGSPGEKLGADRFSVRWRRDVALDAGVYRFLAQADDGVRLWVDDKLVIDQWHEGSTTTYVADAYLWEGVHRLRVEYYELDGKASVRLWWEKLEVFPDWRGEYFNNRQLAGQPTLVRNDPQIRFNWGSQPPATELRPDNFSARWSRRVRFEQGRYRFYIRADDGMRIWLDDTLIIDLWQNAGSGLRTTDLSLESGEYRVQVEYYNASGEARAEVWWERLTTTPTIFPSPPPPIPMVAVPTPTQETAMMVGAQAYVASSPEATPGAAHMPEGMIVVPLPPAVLASMPPAPAAPLNLASPPAEPFSVLMASQNPVLQVEPSQLALGSEVTVRGQGWPAGEQILIALVEPGAEPAQASPVANAVIGSDGAFEVRLPVPDEEKWQDDSELIVLAHTVDWTIRVVSPLRISQPTPINELRPIAQP